MTRIAFCLLALLAPSAYAQDTNMIFGNGHTNSGDSIVCSGGAGMVTLNNVTLVSDGTTAGWQSGPVPVTEPSKPYVPPPMTPLERVGWGVKP